MYLARRFQFEPIAIETIGTYWETTVSIIQKIGCRLFAATGDPQESLWFRQRLGLSVQRGKTICMLFTEKLYSTPQLYSEGLRFISEFLLTYDYFIVNLFLCINIFNLYHLHLHFFNVMWQPRILVNTCNLSLLDDRMFHRKQVSVTEPQL